MGLWSSATVHVPNPVNYGIKNEIISLVNNTGYDEIIVTSLYSNDDGLKVFIRSNTLLGKGFNDLLQSVMKMLGRIGEKWYYIEVDAMYYFIGEL